MVQAPELRARSNDEGHLSLEVMLDGVPRRDLLERLRPGSEILLDLDRAHRKLRAIDVTARETRVLSALRGRFASFPPEAQVELMKRLSAIEQHVALTCDDSVAKERVPADPTPLLRIVPLEGQAALGVSVLVRPMALHPACPPGQGPAVLVGYDAEHRALVSSARDLELELAQAEALVASLPPLAAALGSAGAPLDAVEVRDDHALDLVHQLSERADVRVEWPEGGRLRLTRTALPSDLKLGIEDGRDWFGLTGGLELDEQQVAIASLIEAVRRDRRYVRLSSGAWAAIGGSLEATLRRIEALSAARAAGKEAVTLSPAAPVVLADLEAELGGLQTSPRWKSLVDRIEASRARTLDPPAALTASLRPYQLEGYRWLSRLASWGFGACLADDMGLGKTVQAIAVLLERAESGPALVVAPTSVGFNWRRELERFAPTLRPIVLRSLDAAGRRAALDGLAAGDVLIVGYGLLAREIEALAELELGTLVLDEAQAIKNAATDRAKAVRRLRAGWTLALTGTPLENHLGELWSLFAAVLPGLLGSEEQFRHRFGAAPASRRDAGMRSLAGLIRPFVLRRTKGEVAKDLPPKTEVQLDVTLSERERRIYEDARLAAIAELQGMSERLPAEQQRFSVLAAITRLRQLACHPGLVEPESRLDERSEERRVRAPAPGGDPQVRLESSKVRTLVELLLELQGEGHRALVFSQFTRLLARVKDALDAAGIRFVYLDGQTPAAERERRVDAFQQGTETAFLLSLKAGGTGLNLTAADYVVHLDPWWNPAVEDQATDRAGPTMPSVSIISIMRAARL